jgi:hypothetical protein
MADVGPKRSFGSIHATLSALGSELEPSHGGRATVSDRAWPWMACRAGGRLQPQHLQLPNGFFGIIAAPQSKASILAESLPRFLFTLCDVDRFALATAENDQPTRSPHRMICA